MEHCLSSVLYCLWGSFSLSSGVGLVHLTPYVNLAISNLFAPPNFCHLLLVTHVIEKVGMINHLAPHLIQQLPRITSGQAAPVSRGVKLMLRRDSIAMRERLPSLDKLLQCGSVGVEVRWRKGACYLQLVFFLYLVFKKGEAAENSCEEAAVNP